MGLEYKDLDDVTRALMIAEIDRDIAAGTLYISERLSPQGALAYPQLIREAAKQDTDVSLAVQLSTLLNSHDKPRKLKSGGYSKPPIMAHNAHETLAEGEFNRFYIRAICLRALQNGHATVEIYRAKIIDNLSSESIAKLGSHIVAATLLEDLRSSPSVDAALGLPPGPKSGFSVKLHDTAP